MNLSFKKIAFVPLLATISLISVSCIPYESLVNYNNGLPQLNQPQKITNFEPIKIQPNDLLSITVSSLDKELVEVFNASNNGYLVSDEGAIDYPLIGSIYLKDLSIADAKVEMLDKLQKYFVDPPILNMRLLNFKINIHGEVANPGNYVVGNERISIIDAITLAGDFTSYSSRSDVLIIREENGERIFSQVDFTDINLMNSPNFYLRQNDVVYVRPEKRLKGTLRGSADRLIPYAQFTLSFALIMTTIFNLR